MRKHPNADSLSIVDVYGYQVCVKTEDWLDKKLGVYITPDSVVDTSNPLFSFLKPRAKADGTCRIRGMKLRGQLSFGLLIPVPENQNVQVGDDLAESLGITHYEPPVNRSFDGLNMRGDVASPPKIYTVKYDLESGRRYAHEVFKTGEPVWVTEKLHGISVRFVYHDGQFYVGSRNEWKKEYPSFNHINRDELVVKVGEERANEVMERLKREEGQRHVLWNLLYTTNGLVDFCKDHPGYIVHGECYGQVQDLQYEHSKGQISFAAFDIMHEGRWLDYEDVLDMLEKYGVRTVPVLNSFVSGLALPIAYNFERICEMAEGTSAIASHVKEGVVVRSWKERPSSVGRAVLKWVGIGYLERK